MLPSCIVALLTTTVRFPTCCVRGFSLRRIVSVLPVKPGWEFFYTPSRPPAIIRGIVLAQTLSMGDFFVSALVKASLCRAHSLYSDILSTSAKELISQPSFVQRPRVGRSFHVREYRKIWEDKREKPLSEIHGNLLEEIQGKGEQQAVTGQMYQTQDFYKASLLFLGDGRQDENEKGYILYTPFEEELLRLKPEDSPVSHPYSPHTPPIIGPRASTFRHIQQHTEHTEEQCLIEELTFAIRSEAYTNAELFDLYRTLPTPGLAYLNKTSIFHFVTRMMTAPLREERGMLRYLSIIGDMKTCGIPITRNEWNAAISFAGRCVRKVSEAEVKSALLLWKESEEDFGVPADQTTFNVLLDVAVKARHRRLVDLLLEEIRKRKFKFDRFTYCSIITFYGIQRDSAAVRQMYTEMVDSGEIVDIVVLNALMAAFLRAQERESAERIYHRVIKEALQRVNHSKPNTRYREVTAWRSARRKARELTVRKALKRYSAEYRASLDPDVSTFGLFIWYYCRIGNWYSLQVVLRDRSELGFKPDAALFLALLKGYVFWGLGTPGWTRATYDKLLNEVMSEDTILAIDKPLSLWVLRATARMYNSRSQLERVWNWVENRWKVCGLQIPTYVLEVYHSICGGKR